MTKELGNVKKILVLVVAVVLAVGVFCAGPADTKAADGTLAETTQEGVRYVKYASDACELETAPEYSGINDEYGYLFGGWFTKTEGEYEPIQTETDKINAQEEIYAKFVPSYVLSVKCQNFSGTMEGSYNTHMRVVVGIDSLNYQKVGFNFKLMRKQEQGGYKVYRIGTDGSQETMKTYTGIKVFNPDNLTQETADRIYRPQEIFGGDAAKYLVGWNLTDIANDDFDEVIYIQPYWITLDGTKVYGLPKYAHVEDGYFQYVNVPINLKDGQAVLAGRVNVVYDSTKLEFLEGERGRVFKDMAYQTDTVDDKEVVRCIGVVGDISKETSTTDIYANLRFKVIGNSEGNLDFTMPFVEFGNVDDEGNEIKLTYNVWTVKAGYLDYKKDGE